MAGTIRCAGCGKLRVGYVCPYCEAKKCYVKLYWKGKDYQYRHYDGGIGYGFFEAERFLNKLRSYIDDHKRGRKNFDPTRYLQSKIISLRFVAQVDKWQADNQARVKKKELKPGSYDTYNAYRRTHWNAEFIDSDNRSFSLRDKDVRDITAKDLKKFKDLLPSTISLMYKRKIMNALRTFFRWMHREEIIDAVPPFPIIRGDDAKQRKAITVESQDIYLAKVPAQHQAIIQFAFNTGLREGELAALKVKDVNPETWELTVQRTYSGGNILVETTKGGHKDIVPLSDTAIEICRRNMHDKLPESFLFINPVTGRGYLPQFIYKLWIATQSPVSFHEAGRHSFATQLAKKGATPQQIQFLCRQKDIRTTMRYVHMDLTDLRELVNNRGPVVSLESVKEAKKISNNR